ncbi:MAG TPA: FAD/NAD(P)-binding oxidoreductase [Gemmatimonadales bacterium]
MNRIVILGGGTAGTIMANRLARLYRRAIDAGRTLITVIDQDDRHVYQPGLLLLPFGVYRPEELVKPRQRQFAAGVEYLQAVIDRVDPNRDVVVLEDGRQVSYDVLIVASGTRIAPEETEGMMGEGWGTRVHEFYTLEGATRLRDALAQWPGGRLVINPVDMPIKCPVAPLELAFLADWFFTERGIRDRVTITYVTPLDAAFTKPVAARSLAHLLEQKHIELVTEFATGRVDGGAGQLVSWDDRTVDFDLLVSVPLHSGQEFVGRSEGLGDDLKFVLTNPHTLQAECRRNIFAIGDATNLPASKAGSVAHFEAEVLTENIRRYMDGEPLLPDFDGHANCFVETGFNKALLIDFNYDVEPLPGHYPLPLVGPMSLLKESRLNHTGKMLFRWIYWNVLLPGHDLPGIAPQMTMRGKRLPAPAAEPATV